MTSDHDVWFRDPRAIIVNMIENPDYNHHTDVAPVQIFNRNGSRVYKIFMSGDWAWEEAVRPFLFFLSLHLFLMPQK